MLSENKQDYVLCLQDVSNHEKLKQNDTVQTIDQCRKLPLEQETMDGSNQLEQQRQQLKNNTKQQNNKHQSELINSHRESQKHQLAENHQ